MRFARYIGVQVLAYGLDMGGFLVLFSLLGAGPILSNILSKGIAGLFAFFLHRSFTFGLAREEKNAKQAGRYFVLLAVNVPLSAVVLSLVLLLIPNPVLAKLISDATCTVLTYWFSKKYVFIVRGSRSLDSASSKNRAP